VDGAGSALTFNGSGWSAPSGIDPQNVLTSVSCASSSFCVAVTHSGHAATFNGSSWSPPAIVDSNGYGFSSVACPSSSFCVAVDGGNGNAFIFDGSAWGPAANIDSGGEGFRTVSCASATFCVAVDYYDRALTFNGTSWSAPVSTANAGTSSVSCPSASFCAAAAGNGVTTFNGSNWSTPTRISPNILTAISCASGSLCAAWDSAGSAMSFDGSAWSPPVQADGYLDFVTSVSCPTVSFCAAVDEEGNALTAAPAPPTPAAPAPLGPPPSNISPPTISGQPVQGQTLSAVHGAWTNDPTSYNYQWEDCPIPAWARCMGITGAHAPTYTLTAADVGYQLRVIEVANNAGGGHQAESLPTAVVAASNSFRIVRIRNTRGGTVILGIVVPDAGRLLAQQPRTGSNAAHQRHPKILLVPTQATAQHAGTLDLVVRPTTTARNLLRQGHAIRVLVTVTFTPAAGSQASQNTTITLRPATPTPRRRRS
jgi:hypothetical protein